MEVISLGGEYGGPDIPKWIKTEQLRLNRLLEKHCTEAYNEEVTSIILALRVEGRLKSFGFEGIDDVSRGPSKHIVGADISVMRENWNTDPSTYRHFLWQHVHKAIWACVARIAQDNLIVDEARLKRDLVKVEHDFLAVN